MENSSAASKFNYFEYYPMVNARVHQIGGGQKNKILNRNLKTTYNNFLKYQVQKGGVKTKEDKLQFVYYLQL